MGRATGRLRRGLRRVFNDGRAHRHGRWDVNCYASTTVVGDNRSRINVRILVVQSRLRALMTGKL